MIIAFETGMDKYAFDLRLMSPRKLLGLSIAECKALEMCFNMCETGDRLPRQTFLAYIFALMTKLNVVQYKEDKGRLVVSMRPTIVDRTADIPKEIQEAFEKYKANKQNNAGGSGGSGSAGYPELLVEKEIGGGGQAKVYKYIATPSVPSLLKHKSLNSHCSL